MSKNFNILSKGKVIKEIHEYFPQLPKHLQNELQINEVGTYSVAKPKDADFITQIVNHIFPNAKIITDGTACVGGNVLGFAKNKNIELVNAVEFDKKTFTILKNNVSLYKNLSNKIITYKDDYTQIFDTIDENVIYMDPPWGGQNYYKSRVLDFKFGKEQEDFVAFCRKIFEEKRKNEQFMGMVLRLPHNYNFSKFIKYFPDANVYVPMHRYYYDSSENEKPLEYADKFTKTREPYPKKLWRILIISI